MKLINLLYDFARTHQDVRSFTYNKVNKMGAGNLQYPAVWLEDPMRVAGDHKGLQTFDINVAILAKPTGEGQEQAIQAWAMTTGLQLLQYLNNIRGLTVTYGALSLREYFDDNPAGWRFSLKGTTTAALDLCANPYDPDKTIPGLPSGLPDFLTDHPDGCAVFTDKPGFPTFDV